MYEDVVKELRNLLRSYKATDNGNCHQAKILASAADAIEKLSSDENSHRWIPVTERLPEIDEKHHCSKDVLVYIDGGYMAFSALEENIFGQTWFECERHPDVEEVVVTHWMPLPEPPKKET